MKRTMAMTAMLAVGALALSGCGGADDASGGDKKVEISYLTPKAVGVDMNAELIEAFEAENPDITVTQNTRPSGPEGDNLVKTKLSTGEMEDIFQYNSGSSIQALNPDQNLVDVSDQDWVGDLTDDMTGAVSTDKGLYGAPSGTSRGGVVLYNKKVYEDLGLKVPTSWDEFAANNDKIKAAGKTAVIQSYGTDWTSQLFVLADFGNVLAQDPEWGDAYTNGERKYADEPAVDGFTHQQQAFDSDWFNKDYASATLDDGIKMLAEGDGVHYPLLSNGMASAEQNYPDQVDDIGAFAMPATDGKNTTMTVWLPGAAYIPSSTEGDKLEASKKFLAFLSSDKACDIQGTANDPAGPFATTACSLPDDVPAFLDDMQEYYDAEQTNPALEFVSPVKGPNLTNIVVEVGSGIRPAEDGAALYDEDVKKQAQQLGLEGW